MGKLYLFYIKKVQLHREHITDNNFHNALLLYIMFYLDMYGLRSFAPIGVIIAGIGYSVLSQ